MQVKQGNYIAEPADDQNHLNWKKKKRQEKIIIKKPSKIFV